METKKVQCCEHEEYLKKNLLDISMITKAVLGLKKMEQTGNFTQEANDSPTALFVI